METVKLTDLDPCQIRFRGNRHLLAAAELAVRNDGESYLDGLPRSTLRDFSKTLTLIPAGHSVYGWHKPSVFMHTIYAYINPDSPVLAGTKFQETEVRPRMFFTDRDLWETMLKLKHLVERPSDPLYAEALEIVLAHDLLRLSNEPQLKNNLLKGGLAEWQKKRVADYIEEHFAGDILLSTLAEVAELSPSYFSHAFKASFGVPPHQYVRNVRIERAKLLLSDRKLTTTQVALMVGFSDSSSFSAAFRKVTLQSPSQYRRSLE